MNNTVNKSMKCKITKVSCEKKVNVFLREKKRKDRQEKLKRKDREILCTILSVKIGWLMFSFYADDEGHNLRNAFWKEYFWKSLEIRIRKAKMEFICQNGKSIYQKS